MPSVKSSLKKHLGIGIDFSIIRPNEEDYILSEGSLHTFNEDVVRKSSNTVDLEINSMICNHCRNDIAHDEG